MTVRNAYIKCRICGGRGWWPKVEKVGSAEFETPVWCVYCGGKGEILASKIQWAEKRIAKRNRAKE